MRLRKKWWARPEMEESSLVKTRPEELKGQWKNEFNNDNPIFLELGCGMGKFISDQARMNPQTNFIGIDLYDNVIVYALRKVIAEELQNVRFIPMNIAEVEKVFDTDEISRIYINFCNPWPKKSHNKRRLTYTKFLAKYTQFLKPNCEIWFKTDDDDLFRDSIDYFKESGFDIKYLSYDLHNSDFTQNVVTEYESKFTILGIKTKFLLASWTGVKKEIEANEAEKVDDTSLDNNI